MSTHYKGTEEEIRALDVFIKLNRACDSLGVRLAASATLEDLTVSQFGVLEALYHLGPLCPGELGQKLLKTSGNMTLVVDNLEKRGLIERIRSAKDRRQIKIHLTETGAEMIGRIFPTHLRAIVEEMSVLTAEEQQDLSRLCKKLGKGKP